MKFIPQPMVNWYDARMLARTGLQTVLSSTFGNFADKREIQAALAFKGRKFYDLSKDPNNPALERDDIWIDYLSDTGDGFNPVFTMAKLLAEPSLTMGKICLDGSEVLPEKQVLKRADLLVLGGDQVYPTPEREEYDNRFHGPFDSAFPQQATGTRPKMFAIPGNHDWYDGLNSFTKLFMQYRKIGNWETMQERSYFAIKLPHNYWLWGIDVQLNSDIDKPQKDYFGDICRNDLKEGDKVILCTAEPAWVYDTLQKKNDSYKRLRYFESAFINNYKNKIGKTFELVAILTGDLHHYSRYCQVEHGIETKHLITAGGGGAFLHPTHNLPEALVHNELNGYTQDEIKADNANPNKEYQLKTAFPSKQKSKYLMFGNFFFTLKNWQFASFMGGFYLFFAWMTMVSSRDSSGVNTTGKPSDYIEYLKSQEKPIEAIGSILTETFLFSPFLILMVLLLVIGVTKFTDTNRKSAPTWVLNLWGIFHGIIQLIAIPFMMWVFVRLNMSLDIFENIPALIKIIIFSAEILTFGGFIGASIMGIYLLLSNWIFKIHDNEAFSALGNEDYKCFLRLHITKGRLIIYPIGVEEVVKNWKNTSKDAEKPVFEGDKPKAKLIEMPIVIR